MPNWYEFNDRPGSFGGSDGQESACNAGDPGSIPVLGRSPGGGNGNSLQYSYLENSIDRGTWRGPIHGVAKSWTRLTHTHAHTELDRGDWRATVRGVAESDVTEVTQHAQRTLPQVDKNACF